MDAGNKKPTIEGKYRLMQQAQITRLTGGK
jgi:hypothetical protein